MRIVTSEHKFGGKKDAEQQARELVLFKICKPKHKYKKAVIYVLEPY